MTLREGQERVEVSPGNFVWMNEADRKAFDARQAQPTPEPAEAPAHPNAENASAEAPETAAMPPSKPRPKRR